jgi:glycerate-2-kinase
MAGVPMQDFKNSFYESIAAVKPAHLFERKLRFLPDRIVYSGAEFKWENYKKRVLWAVGKPGFALAEDFLELAGSEHFDRVLVVTKYGHTKEFKKNWEVIEAGHPILDQNSLAAGEKVQSLFRELGKDSLCVGLIGGGGSALMEVLPEGLDLKTLQEMTNSLLRSSASIHEINFIRRRLSLIKGGRLLNYMNGAHSLNFILSDVLGNRLDSISSGMTVVGETHDFNIEQMCKKYDLNRWPAVVTAIKSHLPKTDFGDQKVDNILIGSNRDLLKYFVESQRKRGSVLRDHQVSCSLTQQADRMFYEGIEKPGVVLVYGGEVTHKVEGNGLGGRNQELAVQLGFKLFNKGKKFEVFCAGSDGTDGPTDAAGAVVTHETFERAISKELDVVDFLKRNDTYRFLEKTNSLFKSGPTGTNLMDIYSVFVEAESS